MLISQHNRDHIDNVVKELLAAYEDIIARIDEKMKQLNSVQEDINNLNALIAKGRTEVELIERIIKEVSYF